MGGREWPYKNVKPKIFAEEYMVDESGYELKDYKFFCFGGKPKIFKIDFNRFVNHSANYYDFEDNGKLFIKENLLPVDYNAIMIIKELDAMKEIVRTLAKKLENNCENRFIRIDFYLCNNKIYFGEFTFYPGSGFIKYSPSKWDYKLGSLIKLSICDNK